MCILYNENKKIPREINEIMRDVICYYLFYCRVGDKTFINGDNKTPMTQRRKGNNNNIFIEIRTYLII